MSRKAYILSVTVSAIFSGLTVMLPDYLGYFAWISQVPMLYMLFRMALMERPLRLRAYYKLGLLYFFPFYSVAFHFFVYMYPLDFTGIGNLLSVIVIIIAWFGLSLLQALISALFFLLFGYIATRGTFRRFKFIMPFVFSFIYVICEWFQTVGWWGVPFAKFSISQSALSSVIGTAQLFGSYFITLVLVLVNSFLAYAYLIGEGRASAFGKEAGRVRGASRLFTVLALLSFAVNLILGSVLCTVTESSINNAPEEKRVTAAVIQGNFSSKDTYYYEPIEYVKVYEKYTLLAKEAGATLIVWPETALPFDVPEGSGTERRIADFARKNGLTIIYGVLRYEEGETYNCTLVAHPNGETDTTVYKKRHLVPFGEYMPMRGFLDVILPFMKDINMLSEDMTAGTGTEIFTLPDIGQVGSIICFDSIYEDLSLDSVRDGAELIALGTNDSWFSNSFAIYLHNNHARFRSVECGRYTVRAAVTGVSSIISPTGEIIGSTEPLTRAFLVGEVVMRDTRTLYSYIGNLMVYVFIGAVAALTVYVTYTDHRAKGKSEEA